VRHGPRTVSFGRTNLSHVNVSATATYRYEYPYNLYRSSISPDLDSYTLGDVVAFGRGVQALLVFKASQAP
jgi:hypothetical protein